MTRDKLIPKRRFKEFENDGAWEQRKLGEVAEVIGGGTPSTTNSEYWDGNIDWYSPTEIGKNIFANGSVKKITQLGLEKSSAKILPKDKTILFTSRAGIGDMAILQSPGATNQGFQSFVLKDGIDTYFIYSMGHIIKMFAEKNASGSTFLEVSGKTLEKMPVSIPTIEEQYKIGSFFSTLDNLITHQQRKLKKLKETKTAYLSEMFPKEGEKYPKRRFAGFTEPWEERKLRELSSLITKGTTPLDKSGNGNINFIKIENIDSTSGEVVSTSRITKQEHEGYLKRSQLQENDILFSIAGTLGRVATVKKDVLPANTNQALAIIRLKDGNLNYITTFLNGKAVSEYIKKNPTIGAQPNLSLEQVEDLGISMPTIEEQVKIGTFFTNLDNLITLHQRKLEKLQNIKKAYLNEMFV